jgi:hypothetical protein
MSEPTDELADVFAAVPPSAPDPSLREATLRASLRVLRRGRWLRRGLAGVGGVAIFAAGGVVGWIVKPTPAAEVMFVPPEPVPIPPPASTPTLSAEPLTAERLELLAEQTDEPSEAARLFREAGDRFLADRDYENAARCYRRHLNAADDDARKLIASDSWMLQTMKTPVR